MEDSRRRAYAFRIAQSILRPFMHLRFRYRYDPIPETDGAYLLLANHNMEMDPILVGLAAKEPLVYVASEHISRKGFGTWFLNRYFKTILHSKGTVGISTVKNILRTLRGGESVCLFAEGERSFNGLSSPILPSTGKLARSSGVPLVTFRFEGGYLTQPRWSTTLRRGKLTGHVVHVYSPEELRGMSEKEVNAAITRDLAEDAYEAQEKERIAYRGRRLAYGLESTVYACPACQSIGFLRSEKKTLRCSCGWCAVYDVYGMLTDEDGRSYTVTQLDRAQREALNAARSEEDFSVSDEILLREIAEDHSLLSERAAVLSADAEGLTFDEAALPFSSLSGMAIYSRNTLVIYDAQGRHLEIKSGDTGFNALKYLHLFRLSRGTLSF